MQGSAVGGYAVAGQQYPSVDRQYSSAGTADYGPPAGADYRLPANGQAGLPVRGDARLADTRSEHWQPGNPYSGRDTVPSYEPPQPSFRADGENMSQGVGPRPVEAPVAATAEPNEGLCESAQILARVGSDIILAGEIVPLVDKAMADNKDQIPESQWEDTREALIRQAIEGRVQAKVICEDIKRKLPPEGLEHIKGLFGEGFETHEIPSRLEKAKLASRLELERELEKIGSSLKQEKMLFVERAMAMKWIEENVRDTEEITHDDMLDYYREHQKEYEHPARARWEQLTAYFSRHPNKAEAFDAVARMGNEVLDGRPFADVAKEYSEGITARDGGSRDWTTPESLRSKELDRAVFGLPVGKLSQIIEDEKGFHIIRVVEREDLSRTPFVEAQVGIKEKLTAERRKQQLAEFSERLKSEIPVWTVFDERTADSRAPGGEQSPIR